MHPAQMFIVWRRETAALQELSRITRTGEAYVNHGNQHVPCEQIYATYKRN